MGFRKKLSFPVSSKRKTIITPLLGIEPRSPQGQCGMLPLHHNGCIKMNLLRRSSKFILHAHLRSRTRTSLHMVFSTEHLTRKVCYRYTKYA